MALFTIGYDASTTLARRTGIGRAVLELLRAMVELEDERFEFRVLMSSFLRSPGADHEFLKDKPLVEVMRSRRPGSWLVKKWASGKGPTAESLLGDIGIFHAPASYIPPAKTARRVATVYDLAFLNDSPSSLQPLGGALFKRHFPAVLPQCDCVITSSNATRERLLEVYNLSPERVVSIPLGINHNLFKPSEERMVEIASHQIGLDKGDFLFSVTSHSERKRNGLLLDVYQRLRETNPETPTLVVLGWDGTAPRELRERPKLHRHVHVLNRVEDHLLPGIYSAALATILTSREEGFGFPLLEAQACGSPVICPATSTYPEMGGKAAQYVESADIEEWAETVRRVMLNKETRRAVSALGIENAARFQWAECARKTLDVYAKL